MTETQQGLVIRSTGSWYEVVTADKDLFQCRLRGRLKLDDKKTTNPVAVGDEVLFETETADKGIITTILPRRNYIIRKSVHRKNESHILAANLDQALLIATLVMPRTSLGFIDRFLVTAESFRIETVIIFNKIDLLDEEGRDVQQEIKDMYENIGYRCLLTSAEEKTGLLELRALLNNKKTLLAGHSGVGKSSLVNAISPGFTLRTTAVSTFANKGVHTTTFAEMFELEDNMYLIDSPGIKELGLVEMEKAEISHYFPEMRAILGKCRYHNCSHTREPGCAVLAEVKSGKIAESRYHSYLSMLEDSDNRR
jgi:ribosome biogenesis GTPase / thiamine phosphate phosphatase